MTAKEPITLPKDNNKALDAVNTDTSKTDEPYYFSLIPQTWIFTGLTQ